MSGPFEGPQYGQVEFRTEGERVVGTAAGTGGVCRFEPGTEVVKGEVQGHVLVGSVLLCQAGPECAERASLPVLLVINPYDRVVSGLVRLPKGCTSPALKDGLQVYLKSTAPQDDSRDGEAEPEESAAPTAPVPAAAPAKVVPVSPVGQARSDAPPSLEEGQRLLQAGNHAAAQSLFQRLLAVDERNAAAVVGLAASQLGLGDVDGALKSLERVKTSTRPDVHLWTAYAHLRDKNRIRARESLRKAMDMGWGPGGNRPAEAVPEAALRDDIEFVQQQRNNRKRTPGRESLGAGSPSP
ncbi:tetratricopeptide repeat protein [Pyxidicoccus parkwayensis]|uniref:tetratricopeptide repeat protein n=1 Tax=Pyxidicoccus parkwayensis TaxID=2813578 RepID=UPI001F50A48D|nr:tetratricopeptide repeat protein [Pyxidicoccus parkwaysis]